jgi:hypothetical protein
MTPPPPETSSGALARRGQTIEAASAAIDDHCLGALIGQIGTGARLACPNIYRQARSKANRDIAVAASAFQQIGVKTGRTLDLYGTPLDLVRAPVGTGLSSTDRHHKMRRSFVSRGQPRGYQNRKPTRRLVVAELAAGRGAGFPRFADCTDATAMLLVSPISEGSLP